jgi:hypothetical protein
VDIAAPAVEVGTAGRGRAAGADLQVETGGSTINTHESTHYSHSLGNCNKADVSESVRCSEAGRTSPTSLCVVRTLLSCPAELSC